ncbi:MAG: hypothetical protein ACD_3C00238G0003 [uncultured bacterium (gcode 4)]|uniref:Uncharacterized protein n=1 Tax=uncultured bacterium (gcode 4) TaxID=1234023 RepID=K2GV96_9BACT|nr:MAG: hypothetical protein ACD_3C00238G0003 [uncultured bacterium (gcode 4)]
MNKLKETAELEKADIILKMVEEYKNTFLEAKNVLMGIKANGKKITKRKLDKIFELANLQKQELLQIIESCSDSEFREIRNEIEERSKTPWIGKWVYMELRAWLINLKNKPS